MHITWYGSRRHETVCVRACVSESVPSNGTVSRKGGGGGGGGGNITSVLPCIHGQATKSGCVLVFGCAVVLFVNRSGILCLAGK